MSLLDHLSLGLRRRLPVILQTEAAECGLACLGMIAGFHNFRVDLPALRARFSVSLKGTTLDSLIRMAHALKLGSRPVKLDIDQLDRLSLPCVLHWNFNHFVVLHKIGARTAVIHDPAFGARTVGQEELSRCFTGVALELWPAPDFEPQAAAPSLALRSLLGGVHGLSRAFLQVSALALALELFGIVSPFYMQWAIDYAIVAADRNLLTTLAAGFALVMLLRQGASALRSWVLMYMSTQLSVQWRANLFTHLVRLPVQYFERRHIGDIVSRFGSLDQILRTLTTSFLEALLDGLMTVVTLTMMYLYNPGLTAVALSCIVLYGLARLAWYRPLRAATEAQIIHTAKQQSHFLETVRGVRAIKLFQRYEQRRAAWLTLLVDQVNAGLHIQKMQLYFFLINGVLFGGATILIVWLGANLVLDGRFSVGLLTAFIAYKTQFDSRVSALIDKYLDLRMLRLQGARLADIALTPPETAHGVLPSATTPTAPTIEISGLRYRYAEHEPYVLDGLSLHIAAGESVALVGASGCGKTTLLNIMLGILPPTEGEVTIGGRSLRQAGVDGLRQLVGTVLQDDMLFAGSIRDNISFFDPQADHTWVVHCARMAAIDSEISAMPMAYDTLVGDMGTVLSGGQKQRILLARALYKRPAILFLDEATSHLDIAKEREVNDAIRALRITRVIVAHRPETIASAERVICLEHGKLAPGPTSTLPSRSAHVR